MQRIPLTPTPASTFRVVLEGYTVSFRLIWMAEPEQWIVDIDCEELNLAAHGLALVTGLGLLNGYAVRELGEIILVDRVGNEDPDYDGLGDRWALYYLTRAEVDAL